MPERAFRVTGRVQGVGFRWWTRLQARRLQVEGTVRNLSDGSVEVRARGGEVALEQLRHLLASGPPGARVDSVEPITLGEIPASGTFDIVK
ncbi:MAG TPA: acylphosphatase [Longimicrobium sp.]|nr:acylphosphatase [Longimicrobium sp.]